MCRENTHRNLDETVIGMKTLNYTAQSAKYLRGPTMCQVPQERHKPGPSRSVCDSTTAAVLQGAILLSNEQDECAESSLPSHPTESSLAALL